ncbi:RNA-directed DNA polymerase, eukaryota, reverse transcriptase zinc-binding domain protein [Tanacetum coccineum]
MRSQRTTKIPLKFDDFIRNFYNTKTSKKKIASKNNGKGTDLKSVNCGDIRDDGECDTIGDTEERMEDVVGKECDDVDGGNDSTDDWVKCDGTREQSVKGMEQCNEQGLSKGSTKVNDSSKKADKKSFVDAIAMNLVDNDRKHESIPTEFDENGVEVVVFDEIMVAERIKRWDLTLCGFFVGHKISVNELRYNLKRMWSRHGFKDIVDYNNGVYFMKFHHEEGLNKLEKVPVWVSLCNIPVEAWTLKGISSLASRIGKP